jgi:hypothetical protein
MINTIVSAAALLALVASCTTAQAAPDPLPSWNDGPAKQAVVDFVRATTDKASPKFVPPAERIATFDNDGTLWCEQPMYFQEKVYGIPPEQVVGSSIKTQYEMRDGKPALVRLPEIDFIDDKTGKPVGIESHIGRRPIAAFGNSDGDREMLEWTQGGPGARLMMLVHHDDAVREFAYGADSKVGTFSDALTAEANKNGWTVISMKSDWKRIFAFEK